MVRKKYIFCYEVKDFFFLLNIIVCKKCIIMYFIFVMYFRVSEIEFKYYVDGEDAYVMRRNLGEFREKVRASIFFYLYFFLY